MDTEVLIVATSRYRLLGSRVRQLVERHHLSLTEAAERLGVSRSYFSQLLAGARVLSPRIRRRMLRRLPFRELSEAELWERIEPAAAPLAS